MAQLSADTEPIELRTGNRIPFGRRKTAEPEPDAPKKDATHDRSPSALIKAAVDDAIALARNPSPEENQVNQLRASMTALAILAEQGAQAAKSVKGNGGGTGSTIIQWMMAGIVAAGVSLGVGGVPDSDALAASIVARMDAQDKQNEQQDARLAGLEDGLNKMRYSLGKTIEWFVQDNYQACLRDQAEADALNWLASNMPRRGGNDYKPLDVACEQNPRLPTEMTDLHTYARRVDDQRPQ